MYKKITNNYDIGKKRPRLCTEQRVIFEPDDEWSFAHIPHIGYFKGRFYVMWASGNVHEDDVGQVIRYSSSEDFEEWSEPLILVGPWKGEHRSAVLSPNGWYDNGEMLIAYFMRFEIDENFIADGHRKAGPVRHVNIGKGYMNSTDGIHWSKPKESQVGGGNHAPMKLKSGRLFSTDCITHGYSDNPDGMHGWVTVQSYPPGYPGSTEFVDGEGGTVFTAPGVVGRKVGLCEGSAIQTDDGKLYCFLRSGTEYLWANESCDEGKTWTLPQPTKFTDNRTKFHLGRLPNGKFYYVGTPDPFPPRTRHVLALSLSDDGLDYRQHFLLDDTQYKGRYIGIDKNGVYGYPSTLIKDGYLYVTVSICKEKIIVMRVPCDTL